jgi:hypothetical protein
MHSLENLQLIITTAQYWRLTFQHQTVNLMLECLLNKLVRSLDELENYLKQDFRLRVSERFRIAQNLGI